jgi:flagellar motor protein MotB
MMAHRYDLRRKSPLTSLWLALPDWYQKAALLGVALAVVSTLGPSFPGFLVKLTGEKVAKRSPAPVVAPVAALATKAQEAAPRSGSALPESAARTAPPVGGATVLPQGRFFEARQVDGGYEIRLPVAAYFEPGTSELTALGKQRLEKILKAILEVESGVVSSPGASGALADRAPAAARIGITVESHTDSSPVARNLHRYATNWELSGARSFAVVRLFESLGFPGAQLAGVGYGSARPVARGLGSEGEKRNRRLVIRVQRP